MRKAITISVLFHVALLTWALGYFANGDKPRPVTKAPVPVDIMTPSQFTKVKAGKKTAKKKKTATPAVKKKKKIAKKKPVVKKHKKITRAKPKPRPKPVKKVAKARPKPKPVPKPKKPVRAKPHPKPKPVKVAKAKAKRKPVRHKTVKARPKPHPKPVKRTASRPKSAFDPENIAALLNKLPEKSAPAPKRPLAPAPRHQRQARVEPPSYGRRNGRDATMSANEIEAFKAQISQCWRPPTGGLGSRDLNVKLRIRFKPDGTLEKPPELANYSGSPFFRPAAEAAQRAVWQCQPYRMPKEKYATWRDMILNFDPREMLGG